METPEKPLNLLAFKYPNSSAVAQEIIRLESLLYLPRQTELFVSSIHGEYEGFDFCLRSASGHVKQVLERTFQKAFVPPEQIEKLAALVYNPEEYLPTILSGLPEPREREEWLKSALYMLIQVCRRIASKYSRKFVEARMSPWMRGTTEDLLFEDESQRAKRRYYERIISTAFEVGYGTRFLVELCALIRRIIISSIHVIGDIFNKGPHADRVMDTLIARRAVDIQWGNHDIVWLGAASGSAACIANVVRAALLYGNVATLEHAYGISLRALADLARTVYADDACARFEPKFMPRDSPFSRPLFAKMHKAIAVIQFKLEAQLIARRPSFALGAREPLARIVFPGEDAAAGAAPLLRFGDELLPLADAHLPTVAPDDRAALTEEERRVIMGLKVMFLVSERLQRHMKFMFEVGSLFKVLDGNLLIHGCVPLDAQGRMRTLDFLPRDTLRRCLAAIRGRDAPEPRASTREYFRCIEMVCRDGFFSGEEHLSALREEFAIFDNSTLGQVSHAILEQGHAQAFTPHRSSDCGVMERRRLGQDVMWYLWCGPQSPIFCRDSKNTFERCFVDEPRAHVEAKNPFVRFSDDPGVVQEILRAFGCEGGRMINGFPEVDPARGEQPVRAGGRLINIDGGFSRFSHDKPDARGFTLISGSRALILVTHRPYAGCATRRAAELIRGIESQTLQTFATPQTVTSTDLGAQIRTRMELLRELLAAYIDGSYGGASEFPF